MSRRKYVNGKNLYSWQKQKDGQENEQVCKWQKIHQMQNVKVIEMSVLPIQYCLLSLGFFATQKLFKKIVGNVVKLELKPIYIRMAYFLFLN